MRLLSNAITETYRTLMLEIGQPELCNTSMDDASFELNDENKSLQRLVLMIGEEWTKQFEKECSRIDISDYKDGLTMEQAKSLSRLELIALLEWHDRNGCYNDADCLLEFGRIASHADLIECLVEGELIK